MGARLGTRPPVTRPSRLRLPAAGAALGLGWGVAARAWMRLITTDPEFSWSGTGYILGACTVIGLLLGAGRRRWHPAVRALLALAAAAPAVLVAREVWSTLPPLRGGLGVAVWAALAVTLVLAFSVPFQQPPDSGPTAPPPPEQG